MTTGPHQQQPQQQNGHGQPQNGNPMMRPEQTPRPGMPYRPQVQQQLPGQQQQQQRPGRSANGSPSGSPQGYRQPQQQQQQQLLMNQPGTGAYPRPGLQQAQPYPQQQQQQQQLMGGPMRPPGQTMMNGAPQSYRPAPVRPGISASGLGPSSRAPVTIPDGSPSTVGMSSPQMPDPTLDSLGQGMGRMDLGTSGLAGQQPQAAQQQYPSNLQQPQQQQQQVTGAPSPTYGLPGPTTGAVRPQRARRAYAAANTGIVQGAAQGFPQQDQQQQGYQAAVGAPEQPMYPQPGFQQPGVPQPGFQQPGFQQPGVPQPGMQHPGFQQPGMQHPGFQQPGFQQPGFQQPDPPRVTSKVDVDKIPSPIPVQVMDEMQQSKAPYQTLSRTPTPLASTKFVAIDEGNSNPRFMRITTNQVPFTDELAKLTQIPLAVVLQPLADLDPREQPLQVVDMGENGPIRCSRCKGYVNPFFQFIDGGRKFLCNLCSFENPVPSEYFANLDMNGRRVDVYQRPELLYGSVEFVASKEFMARPPQPVSYVFAIDVSWNSIQAGILSTCLATIKDFLFSGQSLLPKGARIAIMTFDKALHFYNLTSTLEQAQMMVVGDIDESFMPLSSGFLVDPYESKAVIEGLLDSLPRIFESNRVAEPVLGSALQAGFEALKGFGGKLIVFQTALPSFGPGALKNREDVRLLGTDKERSLYEPQEFLWRKMGQECAMNGVCVDLFLFASNYIDVATIGSASALSGGDTYLYSNYEPAKDAMRFANDLKYHLSRSFGFDAVLRVRVSNGLKTEDHYGNFYMRNATDMELAGIDSLKSFAVALKHEGKLEERGDSYVQAALLYTTSDGQRRIRLHNLQLGNTTETATVFKYAEIDTVVNFVCKASIAKMTSVSLTAVREDLWNLCVKLLIAYRVNCSNAVMPAQLILPETFKLMPVFMNSVLKTRVFRAGAFIGSDLRVFFMRTLYNMGVAETIPMLYPRMFQLHDMQDPIGSLNELNQVVLPPRIRMSGERLDSMGAYLIENGQQLILWLGKSVPVEFLRDVIGVNDLTEIDLNTHLLPALPNKTSERLQSVLAQIRADRPRYLHLQIIRQQMDVLLEKELLTFLVEDQTVDNKSYVDFICLVHKQIQEEVKDVQR